jgi:YD repeat-containing protein
MDEAKETRRVRLASGLRGNDGLLYLTGQARRLTNVTSPAGSFPYLLPSTRPSTLVTRLTLPNTSYITNHYDTVARLTGTYLKNSSHTTLNKPDYVYNAGNQRTKHTRADNSHLTFSYDPIGQLTIVRATNSGGTIITGETKGYAYDAAWPCEIA